MNCLIKVYLCHYVHYNNTEIHENEIKYTSYLIVYQTCTNIHYFSEYLPPRSSSCKNGDSRSGYF